MPPLNILIQLGRYHRNQHLDARQWTNIYFKTNISQLIISRLLSTLYNEKVPILTSPLYQKLRTQLDMDCPVDNIVNRLLEDNIPVNKTSLQMVKFNNESKFDRAIKRKEVKDSDVKVGKFSPDTDSLIVKRMDDLSKKMINLNLNEDQVWSEIFSRSRDKLRRGILGLYLSQDMIEARLPINVLNRARALCFFNRGYFTEEEDKAVVDFISKHGKKWTELESLLCRDRVSLQRRWSYLQSRQAGHNKWRFNIDEDELIMIEVFTYNKRAIEDVKLLGINWCKVGEKINRSGSSVNARWREVLQPTLSLFLSGNLGQDVKGPLVKVLIDNGWEHPQDIDWNKLMSCDEFQGHSQSSLKNIYQNLRKRVNLTRTRQGLPIMTLTSKMLEEYIQQPKRGKSNLLKQQDYQDEIVRIYQEVILVE